MKPAYIFLFLTVGFILAFMLSLPEPWSCALPRRLPRDGSGRGRRALEAGALALIVLVYSVAAFSHLGSRVAPSSSLEFSDGSSVTLVLEDESEVSSVMLWSVIGTGSYTLCLSEDGVNWGEPAAVDQNYAQLLRWRSAELSGRARYLRITAFGSPELGEVALLAPDGSLIPWAGVNPLTDEQDTVPDRPDSYNSSYFDEIYHARTALEHIRGVRPYEISHPPLGKLIIALGMRIFGVTPFGWRFFGALAGVLMLPLVYLFARRIFGRGEAALCCTILTASDFMHFVQTRIATIDSYAVLFILLMYYFMYRWALPDGTELGLSRGADGPALPGGGRRLDLALSGLFFGLGAACKWTCLYAGAGLGLIWLLVWIRRISLRPRGEWGRFWLNVLFCLVFFVLVPGLIYYASYYPYGIGAGLKGGAGMYFTRDYADIVLHNQQYMFTYHSGVTATHPYSSRWYQWIFDIRPILYYLDRSGSSRSSFGAFVNPALCWGGLAALVVLGFCAFGRRDRRALFILIGYHAQLVPWIFISRITFEYHYFPCTVFLALALGYCFALMRERRGGRWLVWGFAALSVLLFALFYPALWGEMLDSQTASSLYKWMASWPF